METTVTARGVGNVPESIGTRRILQRPTAQGIRVTIGILSTVAALRRIGILPGPFAVREYVRVQSVLQVAILFLLDVLCFQVFVGDGVQQSGAIDADG